MHGPRSVPKLALTFHGAGDPTLATALMAEAEQANARLTVLAVGTWLAANPTLAARILDGGHEIGNHTWSHPAMTRLSESAAQREIERCAALLEKLTGTRQQWFRPSGTQHATDAILVAAARAGYTHALSYDLAVTVSDLLARS
jgi:peptidoglycan/xylan/chitin deacetylase (PgdA/CDA1 family)